MTDLKVAFDVDGTLIHDGNPAFMGKNMSPLVDTPRYSIIALFKAFEILGAEMYVWSGGGVDYAERWVEKLGLTAHVVAKNSFKPDIAVDDMFSADLGTINIKALGSNEHIKVGFDVNGTLIYDGDPEYLDGEGVPLDEIPRYPIIHLFHTFEMLGMDLYVWSSEGLEFAEMWRKRLGLRGTAIAKDPNFGMDIAIDNHDTNLAKVTIKV
jgi:hypothetical protein